ncbi:MAG: ParB/RepB/Spo0J family partition protein [Burkholderiaceae bacterium]|jgi:ParB family chromosome partitioning protein
MNAQKKHKGLGRGLEALLGPTAENPASANGETLMSVPLDRLQAGKYQPRSRMDEGSLAELAQSIKRQGIIQPILVRAIAANRYEIIAGERRFRAAQIAGLSEVPVIMRVVADEAALAMALIENIQREDLNPLEEAQGVARLIQEFDLTHEEAAQAIGRSRSATSNLLRLLNLSMAVQTMLLAGDLEMGHARALLALPQDQQIACAHDIVERRRTVREAEKQVAQQLAAPAQTGLGKKRADPDIRRLEERLADWLAAPVHIKTTTRGGGRITVRFGSLDELDGIFDRWAFPR